MQSTLKHYTPGSPEFEAIAKTVTPVNRIPNRSYKWLITAGRDKTNLGRRREEQTRLV